MTLPVSADSAMALNLISVDFLRYFEVQAGSPVAMPNWAHADAGCNWLGVAGQVFDLEGQPEVNLIVEAGGTLEGQPLMGLSLTGLNVPYGPGGYEIQLADHTVASTNQVWVQIKNTAGTLVLIKPTSPSYVLFC